MLSDFHCAIFYEQKNKPCQTCVGTGKGLSGTCQPNCIGLTTRSNENWKEFWYCQAVTTCHFYRLGAALKWRSSLCYEGSLKHNSTIMHHKSWPWKKGISIIMKKGAKERIIVPKSNWSSSWSKMLFCWCEARSLKPKSIENQKLVKGSLRGRSFMSCKLGESSKCEKLISCSLVEMYSSPQV